MLGGGLVLAAQGREQAAGNAQPHLNQLVLCDRLSAAGVRPPLAGASPAISNSELIASKRSVAVADSSRTLVSVGGTDSGVMDHP